MHKKWMIALMIGASAAVAWAQKAPLDIVKSVQATNQVEFKTTLGDFTIEVYPDNAPKTVQNFLQYVKSGHYNGTIFHRVVGNFIVQGGGFTSDLTHKETRAPIPLEAPTGLRNDRGNVAMARTADPNSATSQFFINLADNNSLNGTSVIKGTGYAVFGKIIAGMETIDKIRNAPTKNEGKFPDVPVSPIVILSATTDAPLTASNTDVQPLAKPETTGRSSSFVPPLISDSSDGEPAKSFIASPLDECKPFSKYIYTKYGTAIDPRTGLEWTRCMLGQTWNGTSCTGNAITENIGKNKEEMASALKEMHFAGSTDWRTPTREEVQIAFQRIEAKSCIDYTRLDGIPYVSKFVPPFLFTMDTAGIKHPRFFLETYRNNGMAHDDLDSVGFGDEASRGKDGYRIKRHLICEGNYCSNKQGYDLSGAGWIFVRFASKSVPLPQAGAQEFVDPATSLKWLRCPVGAKVVVENGEEKCVGYLAQLYSLDEALERIRKDYPDWRLPTPLEIQYLISRVGGLKTSPGFHGNHTQKSCSDVAAGNALLFPGGTHTADSFVYTAETSSANVGKFWTTNMLLNNRLCGVDVQTYGTAKVPLFLVKGYESSGEWEKLLGLKLNSFKIQTSAQQAIQRDNLAFESSWLGGVVKSFATSMNSTATTKSSDSGSIGNNWKIESTKKVSAVSWHAETYVRCTGARNKGETFNILHLDTGRYQSVTGPTETTIKKVADFHCN